MPHVEVYQSKTVYCLWRVHVVYIESGRRRCRPPIFAWQDGVASPAGKPGKPPGEASNNHLLRGITFASHFARNTNRISNILHVI